MAMIYRDQAIRSQLLKDKAAVYSLVNEEDLSTLKTIIAKIGWPCIPKVGKKASHAACLIVIHADHDLAYQQECIGYMGSFIKDKNQIILPDLAALTDRVHMNLYGFQYYGTQFRWAEGTYLPCQITDRPRIDEFRRNMQLGPFQEAVERMCYRYRVNS